MIADERTRKGAAVDTDESLWQRARVPVREALRADVGVLLSDTEIDRITRLVVQGRGGIWQRIATEYRDMLGRTEKALGRKEADLQSALECIADLKAQLAEERDRRRWWR